MKNAWLAGVSGMALGGSQPTWAEPAFPPPAGTGLLAHGSLQADYLIMLLSLGIVVAVFGAMLYSLCRHRKCPGSQARHFHENLIVEIIWTVIPFLILLGVAYPATKSMIDHQTNGTSQRGERHVASR